jgi:Mg2+/Co2+ transporter CorB
MLDLSTLVPALVVLPLLVAASAFFSSSESAVFSLPATWDATTADDSATAATLQRLRDDPHRLLVTILVGNNLVNVAISSTITVVVVDVVESGLAVVVATAAASALILVFGEIVPKSYGLASGRTWSRRVARPLALVERVLAPVVWVFDASTRSLTRLVGGDHELEGQYLEE